MTRMKQRNEDQQSISPQVEASLSRLERITGHSADYITRTIWYGPDRSVRTLVAYNEHLADKEQVEALFRKLIEWETPPSPSIERLSPLEYVKAAAGSVGSIHSASGWDSVMESLLSGRCVLFVEGAVEAVVCNTEGMEWRPISEPTTQLVIRGPKDSFTESIATNISLIRRRLKSPDLWLEQFKIGEMTGTKVAVMYLNGQVDVKLVREVKKRLSAIRVRGILESGHIEHGIQDKRYTPFPTVQNSERPDIVALSLMRGKVAVLVDGTPFVLLLPITFIQLFQSIEDEYQRLDIGVFIRALRYVAFLISLVGSALYIAAITFHQEMIPTPLLISLVAQREGVPFPALVEALIMEASFEFMREAGVRMPRAVGQAVSIVGALVLGQAAVQAGIVSAAMVIVVAISGISSFTAASFNIAISARLLRFVFMILSGLFGIFGILIGLFMLTAHITSLRSFGTLYMNVLSPQDESSPVEGRTP